MTTSIKLTDTQRKVLDHAADQADGRITWFPDNVKGGSRQKVVDGLFNRALITTNGTDWFVAAEGYDVLGRARPGSVPLDADPNVDAAVAAAEATWAQERIDTTKPLTPVGGEMNDKAAPRTRANSKQATVLQMLQRPEGATVSQIVEATGWQAHTVRGTFAGAFKKKLGLNITSDKPEGGERTYRIA